jgi:hypothetical protein
MKKEDIHFSFDIFGWLTKKQDDEVVEKESEQTQIALLKQLNIQLILTRKLTEKSLTYDSKKKEYVGKDNTRIKKQTAFDITKAVFSPNKQEENKPSNSPTLVKGLGTGVGGLGIAAIITMYAPMIWPFVKGLLKEMIPDFIKEAAKNVSDIAEKFIGLFKKDGPVDTAIQSFKENINNVVDVLSELNPFTSKKEFEKGVTALEKKSANVKLPEKTKESDQDVSKKANEALDESEQARKGVKKAQEDIDQNSKEFSNEQPDDVDEEPETEKKADSGVESELENKAQNEREFRRAESQAPAPVSTQQKPDDITQNDRELRRAESQAPIPVSTKQKLEDAAQDKRELRRTESLAPTKNRPTRKRVRTPVSTEQKPTVAATQSSATPPTNIETTAPTTTGSASPAPTTETQPPTVTASSLSSVVDVQQGVDITKFVPEFDRRLTMMASAFQAQTGKKLLVTSGFRSNEKQKQLYDAALPKYGYPGVLNWVAEPMPPLGKGVGSSHLKGIAIDINPLGPAGINVLAGTIAQSTGWLEKFGLMRNVRNEDWHIQPSETPPIADNPYSPGKPLAAPDAKGNPTDISTGKKLNDVSVSNQNEKNKPTSQNVVAVISTTKTTGLQRNV